MSPAQSPHEPVEPQRPFMVGLTGGIASGKTAVSDAFAELGVPIVDTDLIARQVVAPGSNGLAAVQAAFGDDVVAADGGLDRRRMRELVFADDARRRELESILHPRIRQRTLSAVREAGAGGPYVIVVVPLLVETDFHRLVDRIVVVDCDETVQIERLMTRDHQTEAQARRMLAAQSDRARRLARADHVIDNSGDLAELHQRVLALHEELLVACRRSDG